MEYLRSSYLFLPNEPGVYLFRDNKKEILYVGKAKNLKNRVSSYFTDQTSLGGKTKLLVSRIETIEVFRVESEFDALLLEANYIKKYSPKFNVRMTDGKAYPLIRVTVKDDYPKVLIVRRPEDNRSLYFGPFPNAGAMKTVLKTIRHVFPYESFPHGKKFCLHYHLGLCPCAEVIGTKEAKEQYKKTIRYLVQFLEGKRKIVIKELEKERENYSKNEAFEKANAVQRQIDAIAYITSRTHSPLEYELNPNLRSDIRDKEQEELRNILQNHGIPMERLERIECFDISTIQGKHSTGSMVVFINGEKASKYYRRFKVKVNYHNKPNDFLMMEEVLKRRFKHTEWDYPDLLIVDGGKGQISTAKKILEMYRLTIPLIGLAKREEIIITSDFKEIMLPKVSVALHLVQRIRDEAHRFAITYHRHLRKRSTLI